MREENLSGEGIRPSRTRRHMVAAEQPNNASTTGCRTWAASGSESKFNNALGKVPLSCFFAMTCAYKIACDGMDVAAKINWARQRSQQTAPFAGKLPEVG